MEINIIFYLYLSIFSSQVLELLPPNTHLRDILTFLENVLESQAVERREGQVLRAMLYAENLQVRNIYAQKIGTLRCLQMYVCV